MTVAEYQLALCELMKECPYRPPGYGELLGYNHMNCLTCHGTLEVPLLEGVREKCPGIHIKAIEGVDYFYCDDCEGRGWVASQDPWKWFGAIRQVAVNAKTGGDSYLFSKLSAILGNVWAGENPFYQALTKSLVKEE